MESTGSASCSRRGLGPFWGARYSRSWITMLAGVPLLSGIYFSILGGSSAWILLVPLTAVIVGIVWLVPQSIVSAKGIRLVLHGDVIPWSEVAAIRDPRPGDEEVRMDMVNGRIRRVPGVPAGMAPALREPHTATR
jgi:hypothetical protein